MQSEQETVRPQVVGDNFGVDLSETQQARIGFRLGKIRQERNIPQAEAARRIGVSRSHLSNIEVGRSRPGWSRLMAMATVYDVAIDTLIREVSGEQGDEPLPARPKRQRVQKASAAQARLRLSAPRQQEQLAEPSPPPDFATTNAGVIASLSPWEFYVIEGLARLPARDRRRIFALLMEQVRASLET